jgi:polyisoprenyl-phosphate glycosyltransferase
MQIINKRDLKNTVLSVVIPAYNEEKNIRFFLGELKAALSPYVKKLDLVVVDDGSTDTTCTEVGAAAAQIELRLLRLSRNFGKEYALSAGLDHANGDCVLLIDADFQHPVQSAIEMLLHWSNGIDMAFGVRNSRQEEHFLKRLGVRFFYQLMQSGADIKMPANTGDFRLMDRSVVSAIRSLPERNRFMKGIYAWVGFSQIAVSFDVQERADGTTKFGFKNLFKLALTGLTAFSIRPLRWISGAGLCVACAAMGFSVYIVFEYLIFGQSIPGFTTLAVLLAFLSGVQLISIGILGEYISRIYTESKGRPLYLIASVLDTNETA